jgi:hypothetical protein
MIPPHPLPNPNERPMEPTPAQLPPIPRYALSAPTEADAVAALGRVFGAGRGAERWTRACREAGVLEGTVDAWEALPRVAAALAAQDGAAASVARSLEIRLRTYRRLAGRAALHPGAGA